MAFRKSVSFKEDTNITVFFFNQPPNLLLESYQESLKEEKTGHIQPCTQRPALCEMYSIDPSDSEEESEQAPDLVSFITMSDLGSFDSHFLLYIDNPGEYISSIIRDLTSLFANDGLQTLTVVRPLHCKTVENEFKVSYEGVIVGVTFNCTESCEKYVVSEKELKINENYYAKLIPGTRGQHIWNKSLINKNFLQGFFFAGDDIVDIAPNHLCYLASFPKGFTFDYIKREVGIHAGEKPLKILSNPLEERFIIRMEFEREESVKLLLRRCMCFDGKNVLVLPCVDRRPVEEIYKSYQVLVTGYSNAISPKEFIRILTDSFGPVVELNVNFEAFDCLVVFQTLTAAEKCVSTKEMFFKNHKIRFLRPALPVRLSGMKIHKGVYNTSTPERPLHYVPAPYSFEVPFYANKKI